MMRPPPPRKPTTTSSKPTDAASTSTNAPTNEPAQSTKEIPTGHVPPLNKTYDAPAWGGTPTAEFYLDTLKDGVLVSRERLDASKDGTPRSCVRFGRHPSCDVVVEHPSTSRLHAVIQFKGGTTEAYVLDCGSAHGTFVNKRRVKPGAHAPVRVGDQIKLGESSRTYVLDGDESLMPEEGLSAAEMRALAALEKAAEEEAKKELEALKRERAAEKAAEKAAESSWGMVDDDEEIAERQRAIEEVDWRTHRGKFSDRQEKQRENIQRKEEKRASMRLEIERIRAKESTQQGGLSAGQLARVSTVERAIETLEEEIEDAGETLNESLRASLGLTSGGGGASRRRRGRGSDDDEYDDDDGDEDDFYDRSGSNAQRKKRKGSKRVKDDDKSLGVSAPKTLETATTLWDKRVAVEKSISDTKELISITEQAAQAERARTAGISSQGDALDAYMDEIGASRFTAEIDRLRETLSEKVSELERVSRLLKYADPKEEFRPGSAKGDAMRKRVEEAEARRVEEEKKREEALKAKRAEELEERARRDEETRRQEEWERQGHLTEKRKFTGGGGGGFGGGVADGDVHAEARQTAKKDEDDEDAPVVVDEAELAPSFAREREDEPRRRASPEPTPRENPPAPPVHADGAEDNDDDGFLMPDQLRALASSSSAGGLEIRRRPTTAAAARDRPTATTTTTTTTTNTDDSTTRTAEASVMSDIERLIAASSGRRYAEQDDAEEEDGDHDAAPTWTAPANQTGDGKSSLNAKLGY
jgi:pSer/pThr/pTyr-binding forkhead associated (FHA) protein